MAKITLSDNLTLDRCPHCKVENPNLKRIHHLTTKNHQGVDKKTWSIYVCARCGRLVSAAALQLNSEVSEYYPRLDQIDDNIPSPAGSILLSASSVDSMLKLKGYKEGNLFSRINKAVEDHVITEGMSKWAHKVRLDANDQRHADEDKGLPTINDAKHTLDFAKALGQFLFVLPTKVEEGIKAASPQQ